MNMILLWPVHLCIWQMVSTQKEIYFISQSVHAFPGNQTHDFALLLREFQVLSGAAFIQFYTQ